MTTTSAALLRDLSALLGPDGASADPADQSAYAHDLWPRQLIATRGGLARPPGPAAVAWPGSTEQLAELVAYARRVGARITPFGAGSAVTGALALERDVIAVDTKRMRALHSVDLARGVAVADAGALGQHLEDALARRGATLGHFPSSIYCSTLGGWIATRGAGQCSGRYGKIEDMVVALEGVLGDGSRFTAGPPAPGAIDARALLVGSEGLFGFLTRATMRVWPAPGERRFLAFSFRAIEGAWGCLRAVYQAGLRPAVTRIYDPFDTYVFNQGGHHDAEAAVAAAGPATASRPRRRRSPGARRPLAEFALRRALRGVRAINRLNDRFGARLFGRSLLIIVFEGTAHEGLDEAAQRAAAIARAHDGRDEGEAPARRWLARRHHVSYRMPPTFARGAWVDTMEVAAPWSRLDALYREVRAALGEGGFVMAHLSHAYPDGCSIYFTFAGADARDERALARYTATWAGALAAAHAAGGTIAHHHGVGRSKRGAMRLELGAGVSVIAALADAADPGGVMARGALVPEPDEGPAMPADLAADPVAALGPAGVRLDPESRLVTVAARAELAAVHGALAPHALALPDAPREGTVGAWLARGAAEQPVMRDPVDHQVAGYCARLPSGARARLLPAPRRAAGPELFTLFASGDGRHGALETVTLRVRGADETGPAWTPPCEHPREARADDAITAWLARVRAS